MTKKGNKLQARRRWPAWHLYEWSSLGMIMTATHKGYHAFTAPTWLVAKEPDNLTTCNTVESERVLFTVNHAENDRKFYIKEIAVPRNIEPSIRCTVELRSSLSIAVEDLMIPPGVEITELLPEWKHYVIYKGILSNGLIHVNINRYIYHIY